MTEETQNNHGVQYWVNVFIGYLFGPDSNFQNSIREAFKKTVEGILEERYTLPKHYDVDETQNTARNLNSEMVGCVYQHWKSGCYVVCNVAVDELTGQILVLYKSMRDNYMWVREIGNFNQHITVNGVNQPRFQQLDLPRLDNHKLFGYRSVLND